MGQNCCKCCKGEENVEYEGRCEVHARLFASPDNVKYLLKWQKEHGFSGKLSVEEYERLVKNIESRAGGNRRKLRKSGHGAAERWLKEAKNRRAGIERARGKKKGGG